MKKVLVLKNGIIKEYEVCYDQEYMNMRLEEYRKNFSYLIREKITTKGECTIEAIKEQFSYFNDIVSFNVVFGEDGEDTDISFIGAINPAAYSILSDKNGNFVLDNARISSFMAWYRAVLANRDAINRDKDDSISMVDDYYNLDEKDDISTNITNLLDGVCLKAIGEAQDNELNRSIAIRNSEFISEFGVELENSKKYVK